MSRPTSDPAGLGSGRVRGRKSGGSLPLGKRWPAALGLLLLVAVAPPIPAASAAGSEDAYAKTPWLDVPSRWVRSLQEGSVVAIVPDDLPAGRSYLLLVEPPGSSTASLAADYDAALADLGPWTPAGQPIEDQMPSGWAFRQGVGVTRLSGSNYTALTAVARQGSLRARFWALADSDDTAAILVAAIGVEECSSPVSLGHWMTLSDGARNQCLDLAPFSRGSCPQREAQSPDFESSPLG